jgi:subtilisin family serine protease
VEVEDLVFEAIRTAVSRGIVVIEAAGNGSVNLDLFQDVSGKQILNRTSADFRDSGAILVGAASASAPHTRLPFSNFGGRVDCFAWGERIDTCGDGWTSTDPSTYTTNFGGTSGASPIVAGAALLLQAFRIGSGQPRVDPGTLRAVLSTPLLNTASAQPAVDLIGVMPNLRAIIEWARTLPSGMIQTPAVVKS